MTRNKFLNTAKVFVLALVLSVGIQYAEGQWAPPTAQPAQGNAFSPLNVGAGVNGAGQSKAAGLTIGTSVADPNPALILPTGRLSIGFGSAQTANQKVDVSGYVKATGFCLPNATLGGDCRTQWPTGSGGLPAGTEAGQTLRRNNLGTWEAHNVVFNNGSQVGIGPGFSSNSQPQHTLDVNGGAWFRQQIYVGAVAGSESSGSTGQVLTKNSSNLPVWQTPTANLGIGSGTLSDGGVVPVPSGFVRSQCKVVVSGNTIGTGSTRGIDQIVTSVVANTGVITCRNSFEDDGNLYPGTNTCNYLIVCK